jgi:hypothetical protein
MKKILGMIGLLVGGYIGFLNRPPVPIVGQLPFKKVILAGINLKGIDKIFVETARTSFFYMVLGAVVGLAVGLILVALVVKKEK